MNLGHIYIIHTALSRPPKDKITLCICQDDHLFFWINTNPQRHGIGQLQLTAADHGALSHDCFLDCSRVTTFPQHERDAALHRGPVSEGFARRVVEFLQQEQIPDNQ